MTSRELAERAADELFDAGFLREWVTGMALPLSAVADIIQRAIEEAVEQAGGTQG